LKSVTKFIVKKGLKRRFICLVPLTTEEFEEQLRELIDEEGLIILPRMAKFNKLLYGSVGNNNITIYKRKEGLEPLIYRPKLNGTYYQKNEDLFLSYTINGVGLVDYLFTALLVVCFLISLGGIFIATSDLDRYQLLEFLLVMIVGIPMITFLLFHLPLKIKESQVDTIAKEFKVLIEDLKGEVKEIDW
jgi:hypothetical protein